MPMKSGKHKIKRKESDRKRRREEREQREAQAAALFSAANPQHNQNIQQDSSPSEHQNQDVE